MQCFLEVWLGWGALQLPYRTPGPSLLRPTPPRSNPPDLPPVLERRPPPTWHPPWSPLPSAPACPCSPSPSTPPCWRSAPRCRWVGSGQAAAGVCAHEGGRRLAGRAPVQAALALCCASRAGEAAPYTPSPSPPRPLQGAGALSGIAWGARRASSEVEAEARLRFQATLEVRLAADGAAATAATWQGGFGMGLLRASCGWAAA